MVDRAADANELPAGFLARILWEESRLHSAATSPAGAIGVAQFMPPTAAERGLSDPREPGPAIDAAARLLAELRRRFGNLGLAAAAYNAGPARVSKFLNGHGNLPDETRAYVLGATGRGIETWAATGAGAGGLAAGMQERCTDTVIRLAHSPPLGTVRAPHPTLAPWERRLDSVLARAAAVVARKRQVEDEPPPVVAARALCDRMRRLGARCIVYDQ